MAVSGSAVIARLGVALVLLAGALSGLAFFSDDYQVKVALESATNVVEGAPIQVDGFEAGTVEKIELEDGHALLTLSLDEDIAPLHDGAEVIVGWKAVLSERLVEVTDGPKGAAEIPDGGMISGQMPAPTELDHVLNSLDGKTRRHLQGTIGDLRRVLGGNEKSLNATIKKAGPTLGELGELLQAVGTDGPAIQHLATEMNDLLTILASRDDEVRQIVTSLHGVTEQVAGERGQLNRTLAALPSALGQANRTLGQVPGAVDEAAPLLEDLAPATRSLLPVAKDLAPLLRDLRPFAADLRPTLAGLRRLLGVTPGLLDTAHATVPGGERLLDQVVDPVAFLRPYSPEIAGFLTTWASFLGNYDSNGNFARIHAPESATSLTENPGIMPPGWVNDPYPKPGKIVGQPWTDAYGSEMQ